MLSEWGTYRRQPFHYLRLDGPTAGLWKDNAYSGVYLFVAESQFCTTVMERLPSFSSTGIGIRNRFGAGDQRNLFDGQLLVVEQDQDLALGLGKALNGHLNQSRTLLGEHILQLRGRAFPLLGIFCFPLAAPALAVEVEDHAGKKSAQASEPWIKAQAAAGDQQKSLLNQVFGGGNGAAQPAGEPEQGAAVGLVKRGQRGLLTGACPTQQRHFFGRAHVIY